MLFTKKGVLGVDFGSHSIKLCRMKTTKRGPELFQMDIVHLPMTAIIDGAVLEHEKIVAKLKETMRNNRISRGTECAFSLSGGSTFISRLISNVPQMTPAEMKELGGEYFDDHNLFLSREESNTDVVIIDPVSGQSSMQVLFVVARRDIITGYRGILEEAGLRPVGCGIAPVALFNACEFNHGFDGFHIPCILNVGASSAHIVIVENGKPTFIRSLSSCMGNTLTSHICAGLNVTESEAEAYKHNDSNVSSSAVLTETKKIVTTAAKTMAHEIAMSLTLYEQSDSKEVSSILLSGGEALCEELRDALAAETKLPVEMMNPFNNVMIPQRFDLALLQKNAPLFAPAVGMALAGV